MYKTAVVDESGKIIQTTTSPYRYIECGVEVEDTTHYLANDDNFYLRSDADLSYDVDGLVVSFTALPINTQVSVASQSATVDELPLVVEFDVPGIYSLRIDPPSQYKAETMEVTVG